MHALNTEERPITVLVIEDNPGDARLIRVLLKDVQKDRFRDIQAGTLAKGMELMRNDNIDIVLLDLGLPDSTRGKKTEKDRKIEEIKERAGTRR